MFFKWLLRRSSGQGKSSPFNVAVWEQHQMIQAGGGGGGGGGCAAVEAEEVMVADRLGDLARINRSTLNLSSRARARSRLASTRTTVGHAQACGSIHFFCLFLNWHSPFFEVYPMGQQCMYTHMTRHDRHKCGVHAHTLNYIQHYYIIRCSSRFLTFVNDQKWNNENK